jgi:predicted nucleic acid-binding protein
VIYLLDVNVLIALAHKDSVFHRRVSAWVNALDRSKDGVAFCSFTELGLVRILPQLPEADYSVQDSQLLLSSLKTALQLPTRFFSDDLGARELPSWVKSSRQTTDGHLTALAKAHRAILATLDQKIPGSFLVPGL